MRQMTTKQKARAHLDLNAASWRERLLFKGKTITVRVQVSTLTCDTRTRTGCFIKRRFPLRTLRPAAGQDHRAAGQPWDSLPQSRLNKWHRFQKVGGVRRGHQGWGELTPAAHRPEELVHGNIVFLSGGWGEGRCLTPWRSPSLVERGGCRPKVLSGVSSMENLRWECVWFMLTWLPPIPDSDNTGMLVKRTHILEPKFTTYWCQDCQVLCYADGTISGSGHSLPVVNLE